MGKEAPKVEAVFTEMELIGREMLLRLGDDDDDDDDDGSVIVVIDPDPGVTETITCTEMVCSSSSFALPLSSFEAKFLLPEGARLADTTKVHLRRSKKK